MPSYRAVSSIPRIVCRPVSTSATPVRAMTSLFPRFPSSEFSPFFRHDSAPLFRLLDATDHLLQPWASSQAFMPRFDVREIGSTYELQGELPGIRQEDIEIEFEDANTLVIRGKTERRNTKTSEGDKAIEQSATTNSTVADTASDDSSSSYKKATAEDDYVDAGAVTEGSEVLTPTTSTAPVEAAPAPRKAEPSYKYWVSERSVGQFERRFNFPGKVDQDAVKASLEHGILSVIVPKSVRAEKKITIE